MSFYQTIDNNAPQNGVNALRIMISDALGRHPANTSYPHFLLLCSEFCPAPLKQGKKLR